MLVRPPASSVPWKHHYGARRPGGNSGPEAGTWLCGGCRGDINGVLLSKTRLAAPVRYFGENSIVIHLAFFLLMADTRSLLLKYNVVADPGSVALLTTAAGAVGPILVFWATRHTKLSLLFRRPLWARLASQPAQWHSDGHVTFKQPEARGPSLSR